MFATFEYHIKSFSKYNQRTVVTSTKQIKYKAQKIIPFLCVFTHSQVK